MESEEAKISRNKTKDKIKEQEKKRDKIKKGKEGKDELGNKPTSIRDESNQVGQMTSPIETKRGVLTDGYNGGEILVSEATNVLTKEEAERRAKGLAATEIQSVMRSMRA